MKNGKPTEAVEKMIRTDRMHRLLIDKKVSDLGMHRTRHRILMYLSRTEKFHSQKELAERLDLTPAAVTLALKKMEQDDYIARSLGSDNRFNEIEITEKGRALVDRTRKLFAETDAAVFSGFTDSELSFYIECLEKIQMNVRLCLENSDRPDSDKTGN